MQIHLDPLGGWSGDMFVAACLDAFPEFWPDVEGAIAGLRLGPEAACRLAPHGDGVLTGRRFLVAGERAPESSHAVHDAHTHHAPHDHAHGHARDDAQSHGAHRPWWDIRRALETAGLPDGVAGHAIGIFAVLAEAEAAVHGIPVDDVAFHEVGAVDSIVDIVAAATLLTSIAATRWTSAPLPLGGGRVRTAHGLMPVPAPATAFLLRGLPTIDDGVGGERVTPTGAAIARYLVASPPHADPGPRILVRTGTGFGTRTLPGLSNCLRVLAFDEPERTRAAGSFGHRELCVIAFEVDDQSAEDLALGLDHLRAMEGIHDVVQSVAFGKKGRMATHVQVLVAPAHRDAAIAACFTETATIGLRYHTVQGAALHREVRQVAVGDRSLRVKTVVRPDGSHSGKTEADDVAAEPGRLARRSLRQAGEAAALAPDGTRE